MAFKVGDRVTWQSQSAGVWKRKEGVVSQVVPAGGHPDGVRNPGMSRDHESYVVVVKGRGRYWPRVAALKMDEPPVTPEPRP